MARRTKKITITEKNRDTGKVFLITEMPSAQAENWAFRAFLALASSGVEIPEDIKDSGMAGFASLGLQAIGSLSWDVAQPLLSEMMSCVQIQPSEGITRNIIDESEDIEEVSTRLKLRGEVFSLHVDFSGIAKKFAVPQPEGADKNPE
ncbi:MAG: hypothetical protein HGA87_00295 [Desulfobulbaceae bacterium]|nr:hypothetical protein [Desulfobulbaceae bacterium]